MRYKADIGVYESVPLRSLSLGDEVLVQNLYEGMLKNSPKMLRREKIIRIHDHSKDKQVKGANHTVRATEVTILVDTGSDSGKKTTIKHVLASTHYMLTMRAGSDRFEQIRSDEALVGDRVQLTYRNHYSIEGSIIRKVCYDLPLE